MTRWLLVGIFALGMVAQFVKPVGDALEDKTFLAGALLSLIAYALYSSVQRLISLNGPTVRERLVARGLADDIEEAFDRRHVSIGFVGFTGETLVDQLLPLLERMSNRPGPTRKIQVRMVLPDFWEPIPLPGRLTPEGALQDDREFRSYLQRKIGGYQENLESAKGVLDDSGVVDFEFEFRFFRMPAGLKLYLVNENLVFEGYYNRLLRKRFPTRAPVPNIIDPQGYDVMLTRWHPAGGKDATVAIEAWREYFDELWEWSRVHSWQGDETGNGAS